MPATHCCRNNPRRSPMRSSHGSVTFHLNDSAQLSTPAVANSRRVLTPAAILHSWCGVDAQHIQPNLASERCLIINAVKMVLQRGARDGRVDRRIDCAAV